VVLGRAERLRSFELSGELTGIVNQDRKVLRANARSLASEFETDQRDLVRAAPACHAPIRENVCHDARIVPVSRQNEGMHRPRTLVISAVASFVVALAVVVSPLARAEQVTGGRDVNPRLLVSAEWVGAHLTDRDVSILHVGANRNSYDAGHISGARFVALQDLLRARDGIPNELAPAADLVALFDRLGIGNEGTVVVYGDERGLHAARLFFTLEYLGHSGRVALLDGGLERWRREQREVTTELAPVPARTFTPRINPDVLVSLDPVRDISWSVRRFPGSGWLLIDARPDAQFTGTQPGDGVTRPGHIPGAAGIFWERTLVSQEMPVLRPAHELRKLLEEAGARADTHIVTYCRTGVQASFAYFVARYLGYTVKMYDGSFIEWSRAQDTEVATR
jgi:thiosulfate/3-mercaptopyruvate sulfurtransferase